MGVRPTCCRKASEDTSASSSSRKIAPPTLTTANLDASSCEKRLRYCWISLALAMLDSSRTMVGRRSSTTRPPQDAQVGGRGLVQLRQRHPLVGRVRLGDVARAVDQRGVAGGGEQRGLGPEIHRVSDRQ